MRRRDMPDDRPPLTGELLDGDISVLAGFCDRNGYDALAAIKVRGNRRLMREGHAPRWVLTDEEALTLSDTDEIPR